MAEYYPIPVDAARRIADDFDKNIVVILAWNRASNTVHTTTYGKNAMDKMCAAKLGDIVAGAAGCDLSKRADFEDFRTRTQVEWAQEKDDLLRRLRNLRAALHEVAHAASTSRKTPATWKDVAGAQVAIASDALAKDQGQLTTDTAGGGQ